MRLRDLANLFGVSEMTISRAFNHPERVEAGLRARILAHAERVGYRPDFVSRSLSARRLGTGQLASTMVLLELEVPAVLERDSLSIDLHAGMLESCRQSGSRLERLRCPPGPALERSLLRLAQRRELGGMLIDARGHDLDRVSLPSGLPMTLLFGHAGSRVLPVVDIDRTAGVDLVTKAVLASGRRRPGFMSLPQVSAFSRHRYLDGFSRTWLEAGLTPVPPCLPADGTWNSLGEWFGRYQPDVIVGLTPPISVNLLRDLSIGVPRDVAFISLDISPGYEFCAGLSCRRADLAQLGMYLMMQKGRLLGSPLSEGMHVVITPLWRDGASLPMGGLSQVTSS